MKNIVIFGILLTAIAPVGFARGLLGERYFAVGYQDGNIEDIDLRGFGVGYNQSFAEEESYGFDFNVSASYAELDEFGVSADAKEIAAGIVMYPTKQLEIKPFLGIHAGLGEATVLGFSDDSFMYRISIGGEWEIGERFSITPVASYIDYTDIVEGDETSVGVEAHVWVSSNSGIGIGVNRISDSGVDLDVVSIAYLFSF